MHTINKSNDDSAREANEESDCAHDHKMVNTLEQLTSDFTVEKKILGADTAVRSSKRLKESQMKKNLQDKSKSSPYVSRSPGGSVSPQFKRNTDNSKSSHRLKDGNTARSDVAAGGRSLAQGDVPAGTKSASDARQAPAASLAAMMDEAQSSRTKVGSDNQNQMTINQICAAEESREVGDSAEYERLVQQMGLMMEQ